MPAQPIFGHAVASDFMFAEGFKNLNHGSFGTYPKQVRSVLRDFQDQVEARPDEFLRYDFKTLLTEARQAVADLINADVDDCVYVTNATTGVNLVLRNLLFKEGDVVLYFDTIYGACEKTILSIVETTPHLQAHKIEYDLPCEFSDIVNAFTQAVASLREQGLNPKIAVFDTICSMPGFRFPFEDLTAECKRLQVLSCIDAAHAVGMIALDMRELDPDFFVSNCHKWLYVPRGCAVFYVPQRNQKLIRTTYPTSHGFVPPPKEGAAPAYNPLPASSGTPFTTLFEFVATADNSPFYTVPAGIRWRKETFGSEEAIYQYLEELQTKAGDLVVQKLGTDILTDKAGKMRQCAMVSIRLPLQFGDAAIDTAKMGEVMTYIIDALRRENTYMAVFGYKGQLYTRLSAQTYLKFEDFAWAADLLVKTCEEARKAFT